MNNINRPEDEIKYENLPKNPMRLFGIVYPYFAVLIIIGGLYWVYNLDWAYKNSLKPVVLQRDTVAEPLVMKSGSIMEGVDVKVVSQSTPELVKKGEELYKANCSSCHGDNGEGNGIAGKGLNPVPRNFKQNDGWKNGSNISGMWKTLEEGIAGGGMVAYDYLPVLDRFALIHYIHSLMNDFPKDSDSELEALDLAYRLSEGKETSNQIPVSNAKAAVENDFKAVNEKAGQIEKNLIFYRNEPGAKLILEHSIDNRKLIISLLRSDSWRSSSKALAGELASNINTNGAKASVLRLNSSEIAKMHEFLLRTFSQI
ncbi:MAG: cytochrome c [Candidatus Kapabacteria bacterium]|nr:cytochrome c [Ignavibacteriota bacterium]MCW5885319.1 cytochrome c [Candidatus Kapabacteria bacterium]